MAVIPSSRSHRRKLAMHRALRELRMLWRGLSDTGRPVLAQIIPTRRCNLSCTYCNEYDSVSKPVPTGEMLRRIDKLADLGVSIVTFSGGEPLLHPDLDAQIRRIRGRGMIASLITNGYFMVPERIQQLNDAGLEYVQISIDNVRPDDVSKKSLKVLDKKLQWMAEYADFHVNINSVVGGGIENPEDAWVIAKRAVELGFSSTVGIIHDGSGQLKPLAPHEREVFDRIKGLSKKSYARLDFFQKNIAEGKPNDWRCRAGARYLYICEDGLVHYCSQQRGYPGTPLAAYTAADVREAYRTVKTCAPMCTVSCVHKVSAFDFFRGKQTIQPRASASGH
jgi:MoaA/NifB/PqqE/SkfB family radical SAM enzyme